MIGMSQIKKRLIYGILIGVGIGVLGIGITIAWSINVVNSYKDGTNEDYIANYTTEVVMLKRDVIQGEKVTDDMLTKARVHKSSVPMDQAGYAAVGMIAKYNIPANIPLVNSMFGKEIVTVDERIQEVSSVMLPTGLEQGDRIDIKIKMPSGLEYVVLPQVKVQKYSGTTIWLHLDEEELYLLNSAIVDTYLNDGVVLYGVKYVDENTQIKVDKNAADIARLKLFKKIEKDVADGTVALTVPTEIAENTTDKENVSTTETADEVVKDIDKETAEGEKTENTPEYINFSDNLTDLILKYAIEYRYYVESYNRVERTYEPSSMIMEHMKTNKYITDEAKSKLSEEVRRQIEERIARFESENGENYQAAVSGLSTQISTQQAVRNSTLGSH